MGSACGITPNAAAVPKSHVSPLLLSPHPATLSPCCWHVPRWPRGPGGNGINQQKAALGSYPEGAKPCWAQQQCHHPTGVTSLSALPCLTATQGISLLHTKNQPWEVKTGDSSFPKLPYREFSSTPTDPDDPHHTIRFFWKTDTGGDGMIDGVSS